LDIILGDPQGLPHPVRWMGACIGWLERFFHSRCVGPRKLRWAGIGILCVMLAIFGGGTFLLMTLLNSLGPWYAFAGEALLSFWALSGSCLAREARKVERALRFGVAFGRKQVAMLVGRDTDALRADEVIRATVETVAENTVDGIVAPLLYLWIGGPAAGMAIIKAQTAAGRRAQRPGHWAFAWVGHIYISGSRWRSLR
jgi:adenosylcobinamide-phosphate synthase